MLVQRTSYKHFEKCTFIWNTDTHALSHDRDHVNQRHSPEYLHNRTHKFPIIMLQLCDHLHIITNGKWRWRPRHKIKLKSVSQVSDEFTSIQILYPCSLSDRLVWTQFSSSGWNESFGWVGHTPGLYYCGSVFKSQCVEWLSWLRFVVFLSLPRQMPG
jgi:hypothetical protein